MTTSTRRMALAGLLLAAGCGVDPLDLPNARSTRGTSIVFLGDSLVAGTGVSRAERFTALLRDAMPLPVANAGKAGDTTADALGRFDRDVLPHDPAVVVVLLGGNDFLRRRDPRDARADYRAIMKRILEIGAVPVAISFDTGLFGAGYTAFQKDVGEEVGALVIDGVLDDVLRDPSLKVDRVHPNAAGHRRIATRLADRLFPLAQAIAARSDR